MYACWMIACMHVGMSMCSLGTARPTLVCLKHGKWDRVPTISTMVQMVEACACDATIASMQPLQKASYAGEPMPSSSSMYSAVSLKGELSTSPPICSSGKWPE